MKSPESVSSPPSPPPLFLHHPTLTSDAAGTQISSLILPLLSPGKKKRKKNLALTQPARLRLACIRSSIYAVGHDSRKEMQRTGSRTRPRATDGDKAGKRRRRYRGGGTASERINVSGREAPHCQTQTHVLLRHPACGAPALRLTENIMWMAIQSRKTDGWVGIY